MRSTRRRDTEILVRRRRTKIFFFFIIIIVHVFICYLLSFIYRLCIWYISLSGIENSSILFIHLLGFDFRLDG